MGITTLYSQYIFSLILFTVKNKHLFASNREIHKYKTRNSTNLHLPSVNTTKFYKGPYISCSKAFNHLARYIKILVNDMKHFKLSLRRFLYHNSFYSIEECFEYRTRTCKSYYMDWDFYLFIVIILIWSFNILCLMLNYVNYYCSW